MPFAFPDDHCDLPAEFLISLLDDASLVVDPRLKAAAIVHDGDASFGQRSQVIDRRFCHETVQGGIPENAKLSVEDIDYRGARGLDKSVIRGLVQESAWVGTHENVFVLGPTEPETF